MTKRTVIKAELRQYVQEQIPATEMMIGRRLWEARAIGHIALLLVDYLENDTMHRPAASSPEDEDGDDVSAMESEARRNLGNSCYFEPGGPY